MKRESRADSIPRMILATPEASPKGQNAPRDLYTGLQRLLMYKNIVSLGQQHPSCVCSYIFTYICSLKKLTHVNTPSRVPCLAASLCLQSCLGFRLSVMFCTCCTKATFGPIPKFQSVFLQLERRLLV